MHISDVVAASSITAIALLIQAGLTNWRDGARLKRDSVERQKDREHEKASAEALRREGVRAHWRDERFQAHAALEAVFIDHQLALAEGELLDIEDSGLSKAMVRVDLLGSDESRDAASAFFANIIKARTDLRRLRAAATTEEDRDNVRLSHDDVIERLHHLDRAYRTAARKDLDTTS